MSVDLWDTVGDCPLLTRVIDESRKDYDSLYESVLNRIYRIMKEKDLTDFTHIDLYDLAYKENVEDFEGISRTHYTGRALRAPFSKSA